MGGDDPSRGPRDERGQRRIAGSAAFTLFGEMLGGVLAFSAEVVLARLLGTAAYGFFALAFATVRIGETLALFGLRISTLHFLPLYRGRGDPGRVAGSVLSAVLLPAAKGALLAAVLWPAAPWLAEQLFDAPEVVPWLRALGLALPLMTFAWMAGVVTRGFGFSRYHVLIKNLVIPGAFVGLIAAVGLLGGEPLWLAAAFVAAQACGALVGIAVLIRVAGPVFRAAAPRLALRELYGYALPALANSLLYMVIRWTDILMIGALRSSEEVGIYRACTLPMLALELIPGAANAAAASVYPVLADQRRHDELSRTYRTATRWVVAGSLLVCGVFFAARAELLGLLGPGFGVGATALAILLGGQLLRNTTGASGFVLVVTGHPKLETLNSAIAGAANVGLNLWLIPAYGIEGAAVATTASFLLLNTLRVAQVRRVMGLRTLGAPGFRMLALAVLAAGLLYGPGGQSGDLVGALVRVAGVATLLAVGVLFLGTERAERDALARWLRRIRG